jgi:DNA-binding NarL/FixJ family response regulator
MRDPRRGPHHRLMALRVLIADDHAAFRRLARLVLEAGDVRVVGEAETGAETLALAAAVRPDVVLLDVRLPDVDGFAVCRRLHAIGIRVILCSVRDHADQAAACGALGFLAKERVSADELWRISTHQSP